MFKLLIILCLLFLVGCNTLAEKTCKEYKEGNLKDKHTCIIGDKNENFRYSFLCNKDNIIIYSNKDVDVVNLPFQIKMQCIYMKEKNE